MGSFHHVSKDYLPLYVEDDKLREQLRNADIGKFKRLAKAALFPRKKISKTASPAPVRK